MRQTLTDDIRVAAIKKKSEVDLKCKAKAKM